MKYLFIILSLCSVSVFAKPVNVNSADAKTLAESLSGIGMKKAQDIVQYRTENGLFKTKEDLMKVKGIGEKTVQKNASDILFSDVPVKPMKKAEKQKKSK